MSPLKNDMIQLMTFYIYKIFYLNNIMVSDLKNSLNIFVYYNTI